MTRNRSLLLVVGCLGSLPLMGQNAPSSPDASRRASMLPLASRTQTPLRSALTMDEPPADDLSGFAPTSAGDSDIGEQFILKEREKTPKFSFNADGYAFWTDNAAHVSKGGKSDAFWGGRAQAAWFPHLVGNLFGGLTVSQDWVRYDTYDALNFETFEVTPGLAYVEPRLGNTTFFVQYQFQRLTSDFDELMNRHAARAGVEKTWAINRRNAIDTTLMGSWDFENDVAPLKRNEYIADIAWRFKLTRKVELSLQYRYTFFDYSESDRDDHLHTFGLSAEWRIRKWLALYGFASYAFNRSNYDVYDYEAATLGGGIGLRLKF